MAKDPLPDGNADEAVDVRVLLDQAKKALEALRAGSEEASKPGKSTVAVIVGVELLAIGCWVIHTFFEKGGLKVDATSVALLAAMLIAPFIPKLKSIEMGGAKAQWQENATSGISDVIEVLGAHHQALDRLRQESIEESQAGDEPETAHARAAFPTPSDGVSPRPLRRILWIDDHPMNNGYEIKTLRSIAEITVVTDTATALEEIGARDFDLVVSDIGRVEAGRRVANAGLELLAALRGSALTRNVPVFFYASLTAIRQYGSVLESAGATAVTSSQKELFSALRAYEVNATRETVKSVVEATSGATLLNTGGVDVDYMVSAPGGRRIGLEVGAWVANPQMSAFVDRVNRLTTAVESNAIDEGWLLVREEALDSRRHEFANERKIRLLSPSALADAIRDTT